MWRGGGVVAARTFRDVRLDQENKNDLIGKNDYTSVILYQPPRRYRIRVLSAHED